MAQHTALTANYLFQHFFFSFDDLFRSINLHFSSRTHMEDTGRHQYLIKGLWHKINYEIRNYVIRGRALLSVGGPTGGPTGGCQLEVSWEMLRGFLESRGSVPTGGRWWFICWNICCCCCRKCCCCCWCCCIIKWWWGPNPPAPGAAEVEGGLNAPKTEGRKRSAWLTTASNCEGVDGEAMEAGDPRLLRLLNPAGEVKLCSEVDPRLRESGEWSSSSSSSSSSPSELRLLPWWLWPAPFSEMAEGPLGPTPPDEAPDPEAPPLVFESMYCCTRMHFFFRLKWEGEMLEWDYFAKFSFLGKRCD